MTRRVVLAEMVAKVLPRYMRVGAPPFGAQYQGRTRVPVSYLNTYTMSVTVRRNSAADGYFYAGLVVFDAAGNPLGYGPWLWDWCIGAAPGTLPLVWGTVTGSFGSGTSYPLPAGAAYMAPTFQLNYTSTDGFMDIMDAFIALSATPTVPLTADRHFRDAAEWTWNPGSSGRGTILTQTPPTGEALAQTLTLRYASAGYMTQGADTPPLTFYDGRILQPGVVRSELPADFAGPINSTYGELLLANGDGALGELPYYGLDGQLLTLKLGNVGAAYSTFTTVMQATMEQAVAERGQVRIRLRGPDVRLQRPLLTTRYLGNNALPNGLEGNAELNGRIKPRVYGAVENIEPPCVNSSRYIYQVSDSSLGCSTTNVFVAGVALTSGAVYTNQADMETNAPAAGQYRTWAAGGMFRLGTAPSGVVTCNASVPSSGHGDPWELWNVLYQVAYDAGVQSSEFFQAQSYVPPMPDSWAGTWTTDEPHVGVWVDDERTASQAMTELALSLGAWFGFTRVDSTTLGAPLKFAAGIFPPPIASYTGAGYTMPKLWFDESQILAVQAMPAPGDGRGVPVWSVDLSFRKNYKVFTPSEAPSLPASALGFLNIPELHTVASDGSIRNKHSTALTMVRETRIVNDRIGAALEAQRQLALRRAPKQWFDVRVSLNAMLSSLRYPLPVLGGLTYLKWPELKVLWQDGTVRAEGWFSVNAFEIDWAKNEARMTVRQASEP